MKTVYLLVGVPGSGKTWVASQLIHRYCYVPNDDYIGSDYIRAILEHVQSSPRPVLAEAPFSINQLVHPLQVAGHLVVPVFIFASEPMLRSRWTARNTPESAQKGHLTRQQTYLMRALEGNHFHGTSAEVLKHLQEKIHV